jgi:hypothetical protein
MEELGCKGREKGVDGLRCHRRRRPTREPGSDIWTKCLQSDAVEAAALRTTVPSAATPRLLVPFRTEE